MDPSRASGQERVACGLAVAGLAAWAFAARLSFLLTSPYPYGIDGYFYAVQARSILEDGKLYYPSAPLVPWFLALFAAVSNPIVGAKVGAAAGTALAVVPAYLVARRASGSRAAALVGAALVATSPTAFYLSTEFVKQGVGLTLALSFLAALAAALEQGGRGRAALAAALALACALAHKTSLGLAAATGAPVVLAHLWRAGRRRACAAAALALVVFAALLLFVAPDARRLAAGLLGADPDPTLPALALRGRAPLRFGHEVALAAALGVLAVVFFARERAASPIASGFAAFALFLGLPWLDVTHEQGLAYRLRLAASFPVGPLAAVVFARASAFVGARLAGSARSTASSSAGEASASPSSRAVSVTATSGSPSGRVRAFAAVVVGTAILVLRPASAREGVVRTHPDLAAAVSRLAGRVPEGATVVTPERHIAFMVTWYARVPARLRPPEGRSPSRFVRLLPGAWIGPELRAALDELAARPRPDVPPAHELHPRLRHGLVLVAEPTWEHLITRLSARAREHYQRWPTR